MANKHLRKGRLVAAMLGVACTIVAADLVRRDYFGNNETYTDTNIVVDGVFKDPNAVQEDTGTSPSQLAGTQQPITEPQASFSYLGYTEQAVPSSQLGVGVLAPIKEDIVSTVDETSLVDILDVKNELYMVSSDTIKLTKDAAESLNAMMEAYNKETSLTNVIVYGSTQTYAGGDSLCPMSFAESKFGNTVDFATSGSYGAIQFDGCDKESWIPEHCVEYGYIVRYPLGKENATGQQYCPWHYRYVGRVHSALMAQNNLCLEEYNNFLKNYTIDNPLTYTIDGLSYQIYYTASMGDSTTVRVPVTGNYSISGNGSDGYIVTAIK